MADEKKITSLGIVVDDGYQRIPIRNLHGDEVGIFYFNPTDMGIIQRYNEFAKNFESVVEPLERLADSANDDEGNFTQAQEQALQEATERLYEAVNKLFNGDMAGAFFGKVHPFSPVDGEFYCTKVLEAVRAFISDQFDAQVAKINKRVDKYTKAIKRK